MALLNVDPVVKQNCIVIDLMQELVGPPLLDPVDLEVLIKIKLGWRDRTLSN